MQHLLEIADNELARVAQIAQQTLGFYRDTTRPVDIDLTALLTGVVDLFSRKMLYKKVECKLDLAPSLHLFGLQGEVRQVFSNLLVNAIDASTKSLITVRARRRTHNGKPGVSVLIADRGTGIPGRCPRAPLLAVLHHQGSPAAPASASGSRAASSKNKAARYASAPAPPSPPAPCFASSCPRNF